MALLAACAGGDVAAAPRRRAAPGPGSSLLCFLAFWLIQADASPVTVYSSAELRAALVNVSTSAAQLGAGVNLTLDAEAWATPIRLERDFTIQGYPYGESPNRTYSSLDCNNLQGIIAIAPNTTLTFRQLELTNHAPGAYTDELLITGMGIIDGLTSTGFLAWDGVVSRMGVMGILKRAFNNTVERARAQGQTPSGMAAAYPDALQQLAGSEWTAAYVSLGNQSVAVGDNDTYTYFAMRNGTSSAHGYQNRPGWAPQVRRLPGLPVHHQHHVPGAAQGWREAPGAA